jgi:hypothetical protein
VLKSFYYSEKESWWAKTQEVILLIIKPKKIPVPEAVLEINKKVFCNP